MGLSPAMPLFSVVNFLTTSRAILPFDWLLNIQLNELEVSGGDTCYKKFKKPKLSCDVHCNGHRVQAGTPVHLGSQDICCVEVCNLGKRSV